MKRFAILLALMFGLALAGGALAAGDYGTSGSSAEPGVSTPPQSGLPAGHPPVVLEPVGQQKASEIIGKNVVDSQGQQIGEINELVVDPSSGRVSYAVISPSGMPGMSERMFAVPFTALRTRPGENALTLNIDRQRLQSAPSFDKNTWPDMSSPRWQSELEGFYAPGTRPPGYPPEKTPAEAPPVGGQ